MATTKESLQRELIRKKNTQIKELQLEIEEYKSQPHGNCVTRISNLEREVRSLEADKACLEKQLADTTKRLNSLQTSHNKEVAKQKQKNDTLFKEVANQKQKNDTLFKEVANQKQKNDTLSKDVDNLKQKDYILVMAQVAQDFQEDCYEYVFAPKGIPKDIRSPNHSYNLKKITKEIEKTTTLTPEEMEVAKTRWKQLKTELHWDYEDIRTIIEIKYLRHGKSGFAHPKLTQDVVDEAAAEFLSNIEFTAESLQKLKEMWLTMDKKKKRKRTRTSPRQATHVKKYSCEKCDQPLNG